MKIWRSGEYDTAEMESTIFKGQEYTHLLALEKFHGGDDGIIRKTFCDGRWSQIPLYSEMR